MISCATEARTQNGEHTEVFAVIFIYCEKTLIQRVWV